MDGFDDLLAPTRDALESNPFADPFGRSSSPDPWSSFNQPSAAEPHEAYGASGYGEARSTTPTLGEAGTFAGEPASGHETFDAHADPLESARTLAEEHDEPKELKKVKTHSGHKEVKEEEVPPTPTEEGRLEVEAEAEQPRSPGFRESVSATIDEVAAPPAEEKQKERVLTPPQEPTPPTPAFAQPVPSSPPASPPATASTTRSSFSGFNGHHSPTSSVSPFAAPSASAYKPAPNAFYSPLDAPHSLGQSFAGLSLGGESVNGWQGMGQGSQSMFVGARPTTLDDNDEDDEDDDKPIMQVRMSSSERAQSAAPSVPSSPPAKTIPMRSNADIAPVFTITVDDPQRVGDPIRGYTMYTVHTKTNSPLYNKSAFSVLRRYSDFLWIYETLSNNNPGVVVPPVPEKSPFNRFDASFVQQRRYALEKCITKIANHPVLQKDPDLRLFLESDTFSLDIKHRKAEIAHEKGGLMASLGQSITGPRFYETDEWFDKQKGYLDSLETQLRGLVKSIDQVSKQRMELALAAGEFAQTIADLSTSDVGLGVQLAGALVGLAAVERKAQELQDKQANEDTLTIMSTADEYARLINSVRMAFSSRIRMYHAWQTADGNAKRTKQTHDSNRAQGRFTNEQLSRSLALVGDAEKRALEAKQEFDQTSRLVKAEVARFEKERIEDFKNSLESYLNGMISKQKELIAAWEGYQQNLLKKAATVQAQNAAALEEEDSD